MSQPAMREPPARSTPIRVLPVEERSPELKGRIARGTPDRHLRRLGMTRRRRPDGSALRPTVILAIVEHTRRRMHGAA